LEHYERGPERPRRAARRADQLAEELLDVPVQKPGNAASGHPHVGRGADAIPPRAVSAIREEPEADGAQQTAVSVDGDRAARVVDLDLIVEEYANANQAARHQPDEDRRARPNEGARSGNRDQAGKHAV